MMRYISRPIYSDNTQLVDPGLDLNMEGGMGEWVIFCRSYKLFYYFYDLSKVYENYSLEVV